MKKEYINLPQVEGTMYLKDKKDVETAVNLLLKNDYVVQVSAEDVHYVVEYIPEDADGYGSDSWLLVTFEEKEEILNNRHYRNSEEDDEDEEE